MTEPRETFWGEGRLGRVCRDGAGMGTGTRHGRGGHWEGLGSAEGEFWVETMGTKDW